MSTWFDKLLRIAKKSELVKKTYQNVISSFVQTHVGEITPMQPRPSQHNGLRFNLLVPSINKEHLFGGISTALKFFERLVPSGVEKRIILTDAAPGEDDLQTFTEYKLLTCDSDETHLSLIVPFSDRYQKTIPVRANDVFITTAWWTAYGAQRIVEWQSRHYNQDPKPIIYFIQDYEPCFYPWSSQSVLAESTYKYTGPQIGVFNTSLLRDYVLRLGYRFTETYSFEPQLNSELLRHLKQANLKNKKRKILIYGRPSVPRNAFTLIMEALRIWAWKNESFRQWEILSVGEKHSDIEIGNGIIVRSKGKMTLSEYAAQLTEASVGVSLMISPHPSYPPLEMAHFGMMVITNSFQNKDLSEWHDNIVSIQDLTPMKIAEQLEELCLRFERDHYIGLTGQTRIHSYLQENDLFPFVKNIIKNYVV